MSFAPGLLQFFYHKLLTPYLNLFTTSGNISSDATTLHRAKGSVSHEQLWINIIITKSNIILILDKAFRRFLLSMFPLNVLNT